MTKLKARTMSIKDILKEQTETNKLQKIILKIVSNIEKTIHRPWNVCHDIKEHNLWSKTHSKWRDLPETIKYNSHPRETLVYQLTSFIAVWLGRQSRVATQKSCDHYNAFKLLNITRKPFIGIAKWGKKDVAMPYNTQPWRIVVDSIAQ